MEDKNEVDTAGEELETAEAEVEEHEEATEEEKDTTDWKAKHDELAARLQRAEKKLDKLKEKKTEAAEPPKSGELDETQLDYLDLKGITEDDDIEIIQSVMKKTGLTLRQALKDDYVVARLEKNKQERAVKDATPSGTRRAGNQLNDVDYWYAKFEQTGELPTDFEMKTKVLDRKIAKENTNKPRWK